MNNEQSAQQYKCIKEFTDAWASTYKVGEIISAVTWEHLWVYERECFEPVSKSAAGSQVSAADEGTKYYTAEEPDETYKKVKAALEQISTPKAEKEEWISVETPPEEKQNQKYSVWVWCWDSFSKKAVLGTYCLMDKSWSNVQDFEFPCTHWQYIKTPAPPKL